MSQPEEPATTGRRILSWRRLCQSARRTAVMWLMLALAAIALWLIRSSACEAAFTQPWPAGVWLGLRLGGRLLVVALCEIAILSIVLTVLGVVAAPLLSSRALHVRSSPHGRNAELAMYALADEAYDNPGQHQFRYIDRFWLQGGVLGLVIRERCETCRNGGRCDTCVTYVVFRGTSEVGNWFLTNAQAHMRMASDLFGVDALGGVHSGFAKAHVDLWCGQQDPPFSAAESYGALKFAWPLLMALWTVPGWAPVSLRPAELQALSLANLFGVVVLVIAAIQLFLSYGLFEMGFMRTRKLVLGRPLRDSLVEAASNHVVFIGHSLGGALATLAFVDLCVRPTHPEIARVDLVTFGAPQPGNGRFLEWLDALGKKPDRSMAFIANIADPVAYLPPAPHFPKEALRRITPLAALLSAVYYIGWLPYALCYRVSLGTGWSRRIIWRGPDSGLSIAAHFGYSARSPEAQRPARSKREIGF